jgi:hypothetical protein
MTLPQKVLRIGACLRSEGIAFVKCEKNVGSPQLVITVNKLFSLMRPPSIDSSSGRQWQDRL